MMIALVFFIAGVWFAIGWWAHAWHLDALYHRRRR